MKINLNEEQLLAVNQVNGPMLILAGAGSGKTRVLTERMAKMISEFKILPQHILAVTFTNKAAKEMRERISARIGDVLSKNLAMGTFHSICSKILRWEIKNLGRAANFVVYDNTDQQKVIKECLVKINLDENNYKPWILLNKISKAKSSGFSPESYLNNSLSYAEQRIGEVYLLYEEIMKKNNALDFDDLLFYVVRLFREFPERLAFYQNKFRYLMVDEYQDTNQIQYELISALAQKERNICVVGDVDQSIYSFRNADFRIILNFQKDYPDARIIKLEKNYRSTKNIISLANTVIENNQDRFAKNLFTDNESGEKIRIFEARDDEEEARFIIKEIVKYTNSGKFNYGDFTVLYRTNAQSRIFEEYLVSFNIPHQIIGSFRFFERKEIKDLLSYLKVIYNPDDNISLQRIINTPKRGIGDTTIKKLLQIAEHYNCSLWQVLNLADFPGISAATQKSIKNFTEIINFLISESTTVPVSQLLKAILADTGYFREIEESDKKEESAQKLENIYQLLNSAREFESNSDDVSLETYLNYISLVSDLDSLEEDNRSVKLMTVHTAKGLEFPVVFVSGLAEGVFPHQNSLNSYNELEEERRLMYVAVTRAQKLLYLSFPRRKFIRDSFQNLEASRFLLECPSDLIQGYLPDSEVYQQESRLAVQKSKENITFTKKTQEIQSHLEQRYSRESSSFAKDVFSEGDLVLSPKFGPGKINKILKNSKKTLLIINFDQETGNKIVDPEIANLKKLV